MVTFITALSILLAVAIIILVMLQQGKGSDMGAAFGGGSSNSVFGATGPAGFLGKLTYILVAVWMILVLSLAFILKSQNTEEIFNIAPEELLIEEVEEDEIPTS
ncbi:MAG: preprotein translocase subunit SecG [SAR86 cluster bacterium]|jgi:preprotein translocase subunit SecG|uniref:Protein-export membrane protein SecG n=1 Tax=SAR86 cluster bacterium TaxID=2030880 RepID=A0A520MC77_9GAMM|nr:MAG: preprotein translocase subunit SecG [SAR86 cluster bacterium]|tara:strand:+ start:158 stop:469 length:312 start_codon:yes stop_codon:yes gene_type:complete